MSKTKYDRRRALDCKLIKKSDTYEGYYKYEVTIGEKDGTTHKQPAYGVDMQSALNRLINKERTIKVEKKVTNNPFIFFLIWLAVMAWPIIFTDTHNSPWFILCMFGGIVGLVFLGAWWQNYLEKGK